VRVLFVSAEIFPLIKTGGLADVSAALPRALTQLGADVQLVLPGYPQALAAAVDKSDIATLPQNVGLERLVKARMPDTGLPVWLIDSPTLYDRPGTPYQDENGNDWADNAQRFAHLSRVAARLAQGEFQPDWKADVVHANDWHAGLVPLFLDTTGDARPATVFTIHNLAFQGLFSPSVMPSIGLSNDLFTSDGIEFYGKVSFLKAGIRFSDRITTVSPSYAREILTSEYGCGLDGLLRHRVNCLSGILNGVDYRVWSPATDPHLPAHFHAGDLAGKAVCKAELQRELGLEAEPGTPLIIWLSRMTHQKMADTVAQALNLILERDVQLAILGQGDPALEGLFREGAQHYPGRLAVRICYEESLAHRMQAGADLLLHPCRFEPCGLTPLYAMHYGTLPVVRPVGGLSDTVVDATEWTIRGGSATGFAFREPTVSGLLDCLDRALATYAQQIHWRKMQRRAMTRDFGWESPARRYFAIYRKLAPGAAEQDKAHDPAQVPSSEIAAA
jgi:starch synthase